jgi:hypothetical protein
MIILDKVLKKLARLLTKDHFTFLLSRLRFASEKKQLTEHSKPNISFLLNEKCREQFSSTFKVVGILWSNKNE